MGQNNDQALKVLQEALALEKKGQEFYTQAAERTIAEKGKKMYRSLAEDEVLHAEVIQRQMDALTKGEGWIAPQGVDEVDVDLETPLFPAGQAEFEEAVRPDASDLDALVFALKIENDSFDLYLEQAKAAEDPNAKRLYEYLVDAERTHFNLLMLNYESLNEQSAWV
jgi:rubrerythrin